MGFIMDSIAITTGMDSKEQIFSINNISEESKPDGLKLTFTGDSEYFDNMGISNYTTTYNILGANEKKLYLLSPNKLNRLNVVFLLESK